LPGGVPSQSGEIGPVLAKHDVNGLLDERERMRVHPESDRLLDAERLLKARWKQIGPSKGRLIGPKEEKVTVNDLLDAVVKDYQTNGRRSQCSLSGRLRPLRDYFVHLRAVDVTGAMIEDYKGARLASKIARRQTPLTVATVDRELAALNRAYRLGIKQDRITRGPVITLIPENNARQGFVEPSTFEKIVKSLSDPLDDLARFAYITGWQRGEIVTLEWSDVDLAARRVRLRPEFSKNKDPRVLVLTGDLAALIERRWRKQEYQTPSGIPGLSRWVFHRQGQPVRDFQGRWRSACIEARVLGLLFHDLRRSAVRNMDQLASRPPWP
jgi:integrase